VKNKIENSVLVVTGASRGIGLEIVKLLIDKKVKLSLCSRDTSEIKKEIRDYCVVNAISYEENVYIADCDVSDHSQVANFISDTFDKFKKIDVLINNAAVGSFDNIENFSILEWQTLMNTNINSVFYCSKNVIPIFKKNPEDVKGYIFNIGSLSHSDVVSHNSAYSASKSATKTVSDHLYNELRSEKILVSYLAIGSVNTSFSKRNPDITGWKIDPKNIAKIIFSLLSLGYENPQCCINYLEIKTNTPIGKESYKE
jgi:NADP-dependent 3-hydroxy acid dehydrogenase YdfG